VTVSIFRGDLLKQDDVDAIVNTVNCVGVMGKGIALQFKNKWPGNYKIYRAACEAGEVRIGKMLVFDCGGLVKPNYIINFPTKDHWRGKSEIEFIEKGLVDLINQVKRLGIKRIAVPPLGCGNGGLSWGQVRPLIEEAFATVPDVEVRLFEPAGAPPPSEMEVNTERPNMTPGRAAMLTLLGMYRALNYTLSQIEVQKLAYFLQATGEELKLDFQPHKYGPYSDRIRHVLNRMEGHFIRGVGDGVAEPEIEVIDSALEEAQRFIQSAGSRDLTERVKRVAELIDGFQTPYGMELLSTVHWVATHDPKARSASDALEAIRKWSDRKRDLMDADHVQVAWDRLREGNWLERAAC
jgi:O-acetyl-ADP-ribose deacetylase (regulator of RNase III)